VKYVKTPIGENNFLFLFFSRKSLVVAERVSTTSPLWYLKDDLENQEGLAKKEQHLIIK